MSSFFRAPLMGWLMGSLGPFGSIALASGGPDAHTPTPAHEARTVAHTSAPTTAHTTAPKTKAKPRTTLAAAQEIHWDYDAELGPDHWAELSPEWGACKTGRTQTPIDLDSRYAESIGLDDVVFHYHPLQSSILNNGHTVQVNTPRGDAIEVDGSYYELAQLHFHAPSEHRLNGRQYPMEVHLVHKNAQGNLAVVGLFLEEGPASAALGSVFSSMALKKNEEKPLEGLLDASGLVPSQHPVMRYTGSLTTPPCSEGVHWIVFTQPITASAEQMEHFKALYDHNARPIQALNGRMVLQDATW